MYRKWSKRLAANATHFDLVCDHFVNTRHYRINMDLSPNIENKDLSLNIIKCFLNYFFTPGRKISIEFLGQGFCFRPMLPTTMVSYRLLLAIFFRQNKCSIISDKWKVQVEELFEWFIWFLPFLLFIWWNMLQ